MVVYVNGRTVQVEEGTMLSAVLPQWGTGVTLLNGRPVTRDCELRDGDEVENTPKTPKGM